MAVTGLYGSFFAWSQNHAAITAIVGDRVYMKKAPQDAPRPLIVTQIISAPRMLQQSTPLPLVRGRLQIDLIGDDEDQLDDLAQHFRLDLHGYRGMAGVDFWQSVELENERDDRIDASDRFVVGFDALITWNERAQ